MRGRSDSTGRGLALARWSLLLGLAGCGTVGPTLLRNGRGVYNEAIAATDDEQLLGVIVSGRYAENTGLLTVASVTASVTLSGEGAAQFGVGPDENYAGNLVPLGVGAFYEENPTITYVPVQGQKYLTQLLSPLSLDLFLLLVTGLDAPDWACTLLLERINGIRNDAFVLDSARPDERFERVARLTAELLRAGCVTWVQDAESKASSFYFTDYDPSQGDQVRELFSLLGLDAPEPFGSDVTVPVVMGVGRAPDEIRVDIRSLHDLLAIAEAATEVPAEDVMAGSAKGYPPLGVVGSGLRFRRAESAPPGATVAVERDGWWYFIDGEDLPTKRYFRMIQTLTSLLMSEYGDQNVPVLTLPVAR